MSRHQVDTAGVKFQSRAAIARRRATIARMAAEGCSSRQVAHACGLTPEHVRAIARKAGVAFLADKSLGATHRHDSTRILNALVMDAEHLVADIDLIRVDDLDPRQLAIWIHSLKLSRTKLATLVHTLVARWKDLDDGEQQASENPTPLENSSGADRAHADPARPSSPAGLPESAR